MGMEQITGWSILAVGILTAIFGLVQTVRPKPAGERPKLVRGFFIWPIALSAILGILAIAAIAFSGRVPKDSVAGIAGALALGWALLFLLFLVSKAGGVKLATEGGDAEQARAGYGLLSASGFLSCAAALLGIAIILFADSPGAVTIEVLLTLALGFWLAATFWSLPSALYRGLLVQEADAEPVGIAPLCAQFRSAPVEMAFLAAVGLVVAAGMAGYRFPEGNIPGLLYPLVMFAGSLVLGILASYVLAGALLDRGGSKVHAAFRWLGIAVFLAGVGLLAYFLAVRSVGDVRAFYCFGVGMATAMLLTLTARCRPPFASLGSVFGIEIAIGEALMVLASAVLAFRWMAGYGVALCGVGMLSSFSMLMPIGALWAARRTRESSGEADLPFMAHAASRFAEIVMAGGSFLLVVVLLRLFTERAELGRAGIDITDPYPLIGLVIGGSFPVVLRALSQSGRTRLHASSLEPSVLSALGRWAAFRTLGIWLLAGVTPLLVAFFWRTQAAGAFLVGLAAAELFLILTLWLGEVRNTADEGVRLATRSTHVLALGSGLITVLLVPPLIELTGALTRAAKIKGLAAVFGVLFVWVLVIVWRRLRTAEA